MTWGEFKAAAEAQGVQDADEIGAIDVVGTMAAATMHCHQAADGAWVID